MQMNRADDAILQLSEVTQHASFQADTLLVLAKDSINTSSLSTCRKLFSYLMEVVALTEGTNPNSSAYDNANTRIEITKTALQVRSCHASERALWSTWGLRNRVVHTPDRDVCYSCSSHQMMASQPSPWKR
jgi:hypothetical protein